MCSNFMLIVWLLFELLCKNTHTRIDSEEYSIECFAKMQLYMNERQIEAKYSMYRYIHQTGNTGGTTAVHIYLALILIRYIFYDDTYP